MAKLEDKNSPKLKYTPALKYTHGLVNRDTKTFKAVRLGWVKTIGYFSFFALIVIFLADLIPTYFKELGKPDCNALNTLMIIFSSILTGSFAVIVGSSIDR